MDAAPAVDTLRKGEDILVRVLPVRHGRQHEQRELVAQGEHAQKVAHDVAQIEALQDDQADLHRLDIARIAQQDECELEDIAQVDSGVAEFREGVGDGVREHDGHRFAQGVVQRDDGFVEVAVGGLAQHAADQARRVVAGFRESELVQHERVTRAVGKVGLLAERLDLLRGARQGEVEREAAVLVKRAGDDLEQRARAFVGGVERLLAVGEEVIIVIVSGGIVEIAAGAMGAAGVDERGFGVAQRVEQLVDSGQFLAQSLEILVVIVRVEIVVIVGIIVVVVDVIADEGAGHMAAIPVIAIVALIVIAVIAAKDASPLGLVGLVRRIGGIIGILNLRHGVPLSVAATALPILRHAMHECESVVAATRHHDAWPQARIHRPRITRCGRRAARRRW